MLETITVYISNSTFHLTPASESHAQIQSERIIRIFKEFIGIM